MLLQSISNETTNFNDSEEISVFREIQIKVEKINKKIELIRSIKEFIYSEFETKPELDNELNLKKWNDFMSAFEQKKEDIDLQAENIQTNVEKQLSLYSQTLDANHD